MAPTGQVRVSGGMSADSLAEGADVGRVGTQPVGGPVDAGGGGDPGKQPKWAQPRPRQTPNVGKLI